MMDPKHDALRTALEEVRAALAERLDVDSLIDDYTDADGLVAADDVRTYIVPAAYAEALREAK